jgi:hypothetical protein
VLWIRTAIVKLGAELTGGYDTVYKALWLREMHSAIPDSPQCCAFMQLRDPRCKSGGFFN